VQIPQKSESCATENANPIDERWTVRISEEEMQDDRTSRVGAAHLLDGNVGESFIFSVDDTKANRENG
jgi:hypothetical protein